MPQDEDPIDQKLFLLTSSWPGPQRGIVSVPSYGERARLGHQHRRRVPSKGKKIAVIIVAGKSYIKGRFGSEPSARRRALNLMFAFRFQWFVWRIYTFPFGLIPLEYK